MILPLTCNTDVLLSTTLSSSRSQRTFHPGIVVDFILTLYEVPLHVRVSPCLFT